MAKAKREPKLRFVAHFTPRECQTDEDRRAVLVAFYVAHGVPMPPDVAAKVDGSKTWHGIQEQERKEVIIK